MLGRRFAWAALLIASACMAWLTVNVVDGDTRTFDWQPRHLVHMKADPQLTRIMEMVTRMGSQAVVLGVSGCAALGLLIARRWKQAALIAAAMGGAELLLWILKISFRRARPEAFFDLPLPASYSFPSGHSLLSLCCYGTLSALWRNGRLARIAAAALVLTIGYSRVYLGLHYPTDVIGGFLTGAAWIACVALVYLR